MADDDKALPRVVQAGTLILFAFILLYIIIG